MRGSGVCGVMRGVQRVRLGEAVAGRETGSRRVQQVRVLDVERDELGGAV